MLTNPCLPACLCLSHVCANPCSECSVCTSLPDPNLINGTWPEACRNRLTLQQCTGTCASGFGSPTVSCTTNGWTTTVVGRCSETPGECQPLCAAADTRLWSPLHSSAWSASAQTPLIVYLLSQHLLRFLTGCCHHNRVADLRLLLWPLCCLPPPCDIAVCNGRPQAALANGVWPNACADAAPDYTCRASCDTGECKPPQCPGILQAV